MATSNDFQHIERILYPKKGRRLCLRDSCQIWPYDRLVSISAFILEDENEMTNEELWGKPRVYVHLVHGTWATGILPLWIKNLLPRTSAPGPHAWFEEESRFHDTLLSEFLQEPIIVDGSFRWSGRNSFGARQRAARDLQARLEAVHSSFPGAAQIIVAHSHGGTLAAQALSHMADYTSATNSVSALVCLSTPFLYLQPHSGPGRIRSALAWGFVLSTILNFGLIWFGFYRLLSPWASVAAMILTFACSVLFAVLTSLWEGEKYDSWKPLPHSLRVHLLRTTGDEASLIIGLAQAIHWIGCSLFSPTHLLLNTLPLLATYPAYHVLAKYAPLATVQGPALICFAALVCITILPLVYVIALCTLMLATGMRDPREWGKQIVEVENSPMQCPSQLTVFKEDENIKMGLRHTQVYNYPGVRRAVVDIVRELVTKPVSRTISS